MKKIDTVIFRLSGTLLDSINARVYLCLLLLVVDEVVVVGLVRILPLGSCVCHSLVPCLHVAST